MRRQRLFLIPLLGLLLALSARANPDEKDLNFLAFDRYYDVEQLGEALRRIHAAWPERTRLESMGRSREGRDLWVMTVFDPGAGDPDAKPAMYIDGNTHGNEVQAAEVCLFTIRYLLTKDDAWVRSLLRHVTFHVAPTVNPDGRHRFFHAPETEDDPRRVLRPVDDDRDGALDEDGPDDLDGDGDILEMRIADSNGEWVTDERDPRLMRRRRPDEPGQWRHLGLEGRDEDGDGELNEDPEGGVDANRNWPAQWRPASEQWGAGPYPLSEPETRQTAQWILAHPRIAGVQSYHNAGRMILRPPAAWTDRESEMPEADRRLYDEIGRRGLHVLPTYRYLQIREDLYRVFGGFVDWTYQDLGIFSFTNELWGRVARDVPGGEDDHELAALRWNDVALHGEGFVAWHDVEHPDLGTVQLGGWRRFTLRANPPDFLPETCVRNCLFTLEHASMLPRLAIVAAQPVAPGQWRVVLRNDGVLPTIHEMARRYDVLPADRLEVEGTRLLAAARRGAVGQADEVLLVRGGAAHLPQGLEGGRTVEVDLFTEGRPSRVRLESRLGGRHQREIPP